MKFWTVNFLSVTRYKSGASIKSRVAQLAEYSISIYSQQPIIVSICNNV